MTPQIEQGTCKRCKAPVDLLHMRDGSEVLVDPYASGTVYVLDKQGRGMKASLCYRPHACIGD